MEVRFFLFFLCFHGFRFGFGQNLQKSKKCNFQEETDLEDCGHKEGEEKRYENRNLTRIFDIEDVRNISQEGCNYTNICRPLYRIARIRKQGMGSKMSCIVADMLQRCCNMECSKYYQEDVQPPLAKINNTRLLQFDVIYPVYADRATTEMFEFYFIPVFNFPHAYYFTLEKTAMEKMLSILSGIWSMWRLFVICLLTNLCASFVIWITEIWDNAEEFPRPFVRGIIEGFWWGFISMTTVGYGDKAPRSLLGRIFSIFWILLGITLTSIYVANFVTELSKSGVDSDLDGKTVGVLKNRLYDSVMTSQHGGKIKFVEFNETLNGIVDLMKMLNKKEIDGFLLTRSTYYDYLRVIKTVDYETLKEQVDNILTLKHVKHFVGDQLVSGMLMKNYDDYVYFKHYISSNWLQIQTCYSADLNFKHDELHKGDVHQDSYNELFNSFLYIVFAFILAMICFGVFYEKTEIFRKLFRKVSRDEKIEETIAMAMN